MKQLNLNSLDLSEIIRPGDGIVWSESCAEPLGLTQALVEQQSALGGVSVFLGANFSSTLRPGNTEHLSLSGIGGIGANRALVKAGAMDVIPCHLSRIEPYIRSGVIACDVAFVQVSQPDPQGRYSLGLTSDYNRAAVDKARVVVTEVNSRVPFTYCAEPLTESDIDYFVVTDTDPIELPPAPVTDLERAISRHAQEYIPERANLQFGIGAVPEAIMSDLQGRRGMGIHSGMLGDCAVDLMESGAVDNSGKGRDIGVTVTAVLMGTRRLFDFAAENPAIRMHPSSYTHGYEVIASIPRFVSINSAIEVDLTGQVNSESVGGNYYGAVGGQVDYVRPAVASDGGCSLIALPSTAKQGQISRIVASLSGPVTTARSDVDVVVTEHGAASLRGKTLPQRVRAMLDIADPAHRESLERKAHELLKG